MIVTGLDSVQSLLAREGYLLKLVAHDTAAHFFPHTQQHRDTKLPGLSYEDDSMGNALSAMVKQGCIEFRYHKLFSDARVRILAERILAHSDASFAANFAVTYQGRTLIESSLWTWD